MGRHGNRRRDSLPPGGEGSGKGGTPKAFVNQALRAYPPSWPSPTRGGRNSGLVGSGAGQVARPYCVTSASAASSASRWALSRAAVSIIACLRAVQPQSAFSAQVTGSMKGPDQMPTSAWEATVWRSM